jgi:cyclase
MLTKRLIACLDVVGHQVTKAIQFQDNIEVGRVEQVCARLYDQGVDELIYYDILASAERRLLDVDVVRSVGERVFVPFTVGGGLKSVEDMQIVLKAGAEKISIDSMAVRNPQIVREGARAFGAQCVVVSMQAKRRTRSMDLPSGYEVAIDGARTFTGMDAVAWARQVESLGAGELCINSIDCDGTLNGYDLELMQRMSEAVRIPLIASGGAGSPQHVRALFESTDASAAIISSLLYSPRLPRNYSVAEVKFSLTEAGIALRSAPPLLEQLLH